jgi:hypothetical protein
LPDDPWAAFRQVDCSEFTDRGGFAPTGGFEVGQPLQSLSVVSGVEANALGLPGDPLICVEVAPEQN